MCFLVWLQYSRETEQKEEENIPEALHFARNGSGLRRLRLLAEGLDEAEKVHQMLCLPHRQRAPFCGHPWQRCNKILSGQMRMVDAAKVVMELERIEYVEDPHLGKDSYCVAERHADGGACSVPDYAVIKLFRPILQGEGADTIVRGIDEAIQTLPEGYDTVCTDGMFSQGERQLLSIARAAAADPAVLLLDEITANLDAGTEARVREALRQASRGRTVLSVSHRIYEYLGGRTVEILPQGQ